MYTFKIYVPHVKKKIKNDKHRAFNKDERPGKNPKLIKT